MKASNTASDGDDLTPRKVLVVEDDEILNRLAQKILTRAGFDAEGVMTGAEAADRVTADPDLILLLDQELPDMTGTELVRTLKDRSRTVPFVAMTGHGDETVAVEMMKLGARDYLVKGANLTELLPKVFNRVFREIQTERELAYAQAALRESEERFKLAMEASRDGIWDWNVETGEVYFSPSCAAMLGFGPGELPDKISAWSDWIHPDDRKAAIGVPTACIQNRTESFRVEFRMRTRTGDWRWILARGKTVARRADGRAIRLVGTHTDITDQKRAEKKMAYYYNLFESVIKQAPFAVHVLTGDFDNASILIENEESRRLMGQEFEGRTALDLNLPDSVNARFFTPDGAREIPLPEMPSPRAMRGEVVTNEEYRFRHPDGTEYLVIANASPVLNEAGEIVAAVATFHDITDQKAAEAEKTRLERQFQQAQRLESVGRLAGGVAHDLNNLLSPILGYAEMLADAAGEDTDRRWQAEEIVKASLRARDLVRRLLAFSRRQTLSLKPVDLNALVERFHPLLRRTIREDIDIRAHLSPNLPKVAGDVGQLEQVIMNLAVNAQDAMPIGGVLTVETGMVELDEAFAARHDDLNPGPHVLLAVTDTGCGMDAETRTHLFEPFFTTREIDKGTGLGLATVYGIIKQHNGHIRVDSEPGAGSTFSIYLPRHAGADAGETDAGARSSTSDPLSAPRGAETVLLVEDNDLVQELAVTILKRQGYMVLTAASGDEAMALLDRYEGPVHLLLTDVVMPGMNGRQLFEKATPVHPDLKVLYMSGYTDNVLADRGVEETAGHFIQKPFSVNALAAKVRAILDE